MKVNQPITKTEHQLADEKHAKLVERQKVYFNKLAGRIEAGEPLDDSDRKLAAMLIRRSAKSISAIRKKSRGGKKPDLIRDIVRLDYARLVVLEGKSSNTAIELLCDKHQTETGPVSVTAIKDKLGMIKNKSGSEQRKQETDFFIELFRRSKQP